MRGPNTGPVGLISNARARSLSRAGSSTRNTPPESWRIARSPASSSSSGSGRAASTALNTSDCQADTRKRASRRLAHRDLAGAQPARALRVVAGAAEALLAEPVRQSARRDLGAARLRSHASRGVHSAHANREAIAGQVSRAQLVGMAHRFEHARAGQLERERGVGVESGHREPLRRDRDAVLAPRITHVLRPRAGHTREIARDLLGRAQPLLHAHERVTTRPGRRIERLLVDAEVLGRGADPDHANNGSCDTGVKLLRCSGHGPSRARAAKWSRVE